MSRLLTELFYNGVDLIAEYGLVASGAGTRLSPERDVEEIEVPGRNGNLIIDKKRFRNVNIVYTCALPEEFRSRFDELKNFLLSVRGYAKLQDSEDSDHYRMAAVSGVLEPTIKGKDGASLVIAFNCKPQRFRKEDIEKTLSPNSVSACNLLDVDSLDSRIISDLKRSGLYKKGDKYVELVYTTKRSYAVGSVMELSNKGIGNPLYIISSGSISYIWYGKSKQSAIANVTWNYYFKQIAGQQLIWDGDVIYTDGLLETDELINPTSSESKPVIVIDTPSAINGYIGNINGSFVYADFNPNFKVKGADVTVNKVTFDAETYNFYSIPEHNNAGELVNLNAFFGIDGDASLAPGSNKIAFALVGGAEIEGRIYDL